MNGTMPDLNDLYFFVQVVEHGGFAPAGRALGVPKSRLSRRIAELEASLGVRLIQRSTRRFSVTDVGQGFLRHAKAMLVEAEAALDTVQRHHGQPRGVVRMACPTALLDIAVGRMLATFLRQYPDVELQLDATHRRVDVIGEGFDLAVRVRRPPLEDSDLVLRTLAEATQCLVASPVLLAKHGLPQAPADLMQLPSVELGQPQNQHVWDLHDDRGGHMAIHHQPRLVTRGMFTLRDAAIEGVGVAQLPTLLIEAAIASGELQIVLPQWRPLPDIVHVVYPSRRGMLPAVRALIDHLAEGFAARGAKL